jgi:ABC-type Fe3+-hydroxamate transport system substrate-binding protein
MTVLTDFTKEKVEIPDKLDSIISLNPSITETLCFLGLEQKLKGISAFCRRPESVNSIPKIGSYSTFNQTQVDKISPDIVLTVSGYQDDLTKKLKEKYTVFQFELPSTLFGILDMINRIGIVTKRISEAQILNRQLETNLHLRKISLRGYLEIDLGGPVSFGNLSYITSSLNLSGLSTPFDNDYREWLEPDYEYIRDFDPEIIIMEGKMYRGITQPEALKKLSETPIKDTTAFKSKRIYCTPGKLDFFAHHGPSFFISTLPWLENVIYSAGK